MSTRTRPRPSIKAVRNALHYDPVTGLIWWKRSGSGRDISKPAGFVDKHGYVRIYFAGGMHQGSILAWAIVKGRWPKKEVDHRDTVKNNNRWKNLRLATHGQNQANGCRYKNNKSGFKGVALDYGGKWRASIQCNKILHYLGLHETREQAHAAYAAAAKKLHKEFARF